MTYTTITHENPVTFENLKVGDFFICVNSLLYLKTSVDVAYCFGHEEIKYLSKDTKVSHIKEVEIVCAM